MNKNNSYWTDYWESDGAAGEVFVNKDGLKPYYLTDFWTEFLSKYQDGNKIIDINSGAGSVYDNIINKDIFYVSTDLSVSALKIQNSRLDKVNVVSANSTQLPFKDRSFDGVVSQFGIEYSGIESLINATNLLKSKGKLCFFSHYENGYIDNRNKLFLQGAQVAINSGFIEKAILLSRAQFSKSKSRITICKGNFIKSERLLYEEIKRNSTGIHVHLYNGFQQMILNYKKYYCDDICKWLTDMQKDIVKNIYKVSEIRKVCLTEQDIDFIKQELNKLGLIKVSCEPFYIPDTDNIISWVISGERV